MTDNDRWILALERAVYAETLRPPTSGDYVVGGLPCVVISRFSERRHCGCLPIDLGIVGDDGVAAWSRLVQLCADHRRLDLRPGPETI